MTRMRIITISAGPYGHVLEVHMVFGKSASLVTENMLNLT